MAEAQQTIDQNLADSIAMLEQILEVMPHDADALRALYSAYKRGGKQTEAFDYLSRIVDVFMDNRDAELLAFIQEELAVYEAQCPSEVAAQSARLRMVTEADVASANELSNSETASAPSHAKKKNEVDISEELALAWRLYEEGQLTQEEYSSVLHDLTEVSSKELDVPISVLHVLNDRGFTQISRIMNYLSTRSGVPCISLTNFELSEDLVNVLPLDIMAHDGALPFAFLGNDLMVAVLSPYNNVLVDKVEAVSGQRCHTYLVEPEDYDLALGKVRSIVAAANPPVQP